MFATASSISPLRKIILSCRPLSEIERDTDRDNYLSAQQAQEYGLIDKVFYKR